MLTTVIAIIGALTGTIGLILRYLDFRKEKPRLKINLSDTFKSYVAPTDYINTKGMRYLDSQNTVVISLSIKNNSKQPVTIDKITYKRIYNNGKRWSDIETINFELKNFTKKVSKNSLSTTYLRLPQATSPQFPIRLEEFDSVSFSFFIPFINSELIKHGKYNIKLKIQTPPKVHCVNLTVPEIHQIVPDLDTYTRHE